MSREQGADAYTMILDAIDRGDFAPGARLVETELAELFAAGASPRRVLVYVGTVRFVDVRGLQLLLDLAGQVRRRGGELAVVAAPQCLERMVEVFGLGGQLPMVTALSRTTWRARTPGRWQR